MVPIKKVSVYAHTRKSSCKSFLPTMAAELLFCLSRDLLKLFESSAVHDVAITVGETPNIKIFKAHSAILVSRSPYFTTALSSNWAKKENDVTVFTKPNITPKIFGILLK